MISLPGLSLRHRQPLFGLDIGHSSLKVMQLETDGAKNKKPVVIGYGTSYRYAADAIKDGVIVDYDALGNALRDLFNKHLNGSVTTRHVACTIPLSHSFSRPLKLPAMEESNLEEAVKLEAEQYIPVSSDNLYIDYDVILRDNENIELLLVATPKKIVDSYMSFLEAMGLEPLAFEPTMNATARIFGLADPTHDAPTVLVDIGANASDIAVFDKTLFVNSTIQGGGSTMISQIAERLGVSREEAYELKNKEGIGLIGHHRGIADAVKPVLDSLVREVRKVARYYDERMAASGKAIAQTIITGGGANMNGLNEYLSKELDMPVRMMDPWEEIDFGGLPMPSMLERSMFTTVAGEAVLDASEIYND